MLYAEVLFQVLLEPLHCRAIDKRSSINHFMDGCIHFGFDLVVLGFEVHHPDGSHRYSKFWLVNIFLLRAAKVVKKPGVNAVVVQR
jgi:hypothetical protein